MCNIAGYIGRREAAPILVEMMKREEGYAAGYYTGITVHDGAALGTRKVMGGLDRLLAETEALSLRGTCGFIHSRSKSGGGPEWGQPFLSRDGRSSLIANGMAGEFLTPEMKQKRCDTVLSLERDGYTFTSRSPGVVGDYPALADGTAVHSTDVMCQYVTRLIDGGMPPAAAMSELMRELPCEAVVLLMRQECPDSIFISRVNYPMTVGIAEDGDVYFATTRLAFPEDVTFREVYLLPPSHTYTVTRGGTVAGEPMGLPIGVSEITPALVERAYPLFVGALAESGRPLSGAELLSSYEEIWPEGALTQREPLLYVLLERLAAEGRLGVERHKAEGAAPDYLATRFGIYLKK